MIVESESQNWWGIATPVNSGSSRSNSETLSQVEPVPNFGGVTRNPKALSGSEKNANRASIAVACVACRSKHLKCDGSNPCSRCTAERVSCTYVKSRRGFKGPRRVKKGEQLKAPEEKPSLQRDNKKKPTDLAISLGDDFQSPQQGSISSPPKNLDSFSSPQSSSGASQQSHAVGDGISIYVNAFYHFFHSSHPFLLPKEHLLKHLSTNPNPQLYLAIQYVAARFIANVSTLQLRNTLKQDLLDCSPPKDGFIVQALLLLTVGLQAENEQEDANRALIATTALALELGMNLATFSITNSNGSSIYAESWRRTYWQLYVVNGWLSGANPHSSFQLQDVFSDVPLPCEEIVYTRGGSSEVRTLEEFDAASFGEEDVVFSSFAYLVSAVRTLGKVLAACKTMNPNDRAFSSADTELVNWKLHLPAPKRDLMKLNGQVDDILFQAHMVINAATIMLHRPNSPSLAFMTSQDVTTCVPSSRSYGPSPNVDAHMVKSMQSAEELSKLIRFPLPIRRRTPFFSCAIVMASIVHLSYWSFMVPDGQDDDIKGLIKLDIGALKSLGEVWPIANACVGQVRGVSGELFNSKKALAMHSWASLTGEQIFDTIVEGVDTNSLEAPLYPNEIWTIE